MVEVKHKTVEQKCLSNVYKEVEVLDSKEKKEEVEMLVVK